MTGLSELLRHPVAESLGWSLLHFAWQGAIIGVAVAIILASMRRVSAGTRYAVAIAGLLFMVATPASTTVWRLMAHAPLQAPQSDFTEADSGFELPTASPTMSNHSVAAETPTVSEDDAAVLTIINEISEVSTESPAALSPTFEQSLSLSAQFSPWLSWIVLAWLAGVSLLSLRLGATWLKVQRLRYVGISVASDRLQRLMSSVSNRLGLSQTVELFESALVQVPTAAGAFRPVILLPVSAVTGLSMDQLEAILAHELAHIRRHDYLVNLGQTFVETLLFYHPAVWWLSRRIRDERENCCDDLASEVCRNRVTYAEALVRMEEIRGESPRIVMASSGGNLGSRIRRIVATKIEPSVPDQWLGGSTALVIAATVIVALWSFCPVANEATAEADEHASRGDSTHYVVAWGFDTDVDTMHEMRQSGTPVEVTESQSDGSTVVAWKIDAEIVRSAGAESIDDAKRVLPRGVQWLRDPSWINSVGAYRGPPPNMFSLGVFPDVNDAPRGSYWNLSGTFDLNSADNSAEFSLTVAWSVPGLKLESIPTTAGSSLTADSALVVARSFPNGRVGVAVFECVRVPDGNWSKFSQLTSAELWLAHGPDRALEIVNRAEDWVRDDAPSRITPDQKWVNGTIPYAELSLVALSRPRQDPFVWWNPDGNAIHCESNLNDETYSPASRSKQSDQLLLLLRARRNSSRRFADDSIDLKNIYVSSPRGATDEAVSRPDHPDAQFVAFSIPAGSLEEATSVSAGIGTGEWETASEIHADEALERPEGEYRVRLGSGTNDRYVNSTLTFPDVSDREVQVIAVSKSGKRIPTLRPHRVFLREADGTGTRLYQQCLMDVADLSHFELQMRPVLWVTFSDVVTMPDQLAAVDVETDAKEQSKPDDDCPPNLTPAQIADEIEKAMKLVVSSEIEVDFFSRRNTNAWKKDAPTVWAGGKGDFLFRTDGPRWLFRENGFTTSVGRKDSIPRKRLSAFDGKLHYSLKWGNTLFIGEDDLANPQYSAAHQFWAAGRNPDFLISRLRQKEARIVKAAANDDRQCAVTVETSWMAGELEWKYRVTLLPFRSYIPVEATLHIGENVDAEWSASELREQGGVWYPTRMDLKRYLGPKPDRQRKSTVTAFRLRDDFREDDFRPPEGTGRDIVDHRQGIAWHNAPWWSELGPFMQKTRNWPRAQTRLADEIPTHSGLKIDGKPAPAITSAEWLNGNPGPWNRKGRKVSLLYFLGGRAITPTPKWMSGLRELHRIYRNDGLELIGVATASRTIEMTKRDMKSLGADFPIAIDQEQDGAQWGRTFEAFELPLYTGVMLVDHTGKIRLVKKEERYLDGIANAAVERSLGSLRSLIVRLLADAGVENPNVEPDKTTMDQVDGRVLKAEWLRLREQVDGKATISGEYLDGNSGVSGVSVSLVPSLRVLFSTTPGGWTLYHDRNNTLKTRTAKDGTFRFTGLPKGKYTLTFKAEGRANIDREVTVSKHDSTVVSDVGNSQGSRLAGRILDKDGKAVSGARIQLTKRHTDRTSPRRYTTAHLPRESVTSDKDGRFEYTDLYVGYYTFEVTATGFEKATEVFVEAGAVDVEVRLQSSKPTKIIDDAQGAAALSDDEDAAPEIVAPVAAEVARTKNAPASRATAHGVIVDDAGRPIADADVWLLPFDEKPAGPALKSVSFVDGSFSIPVPDGWTCFEQDALSLPLRIVAWAEGRVLASSTSRLERKEGWSSKAIRLTLAGKTQHVFRVLDPFGNPVEGARVDPQRALVDGRMRQLPEGLIRKLGNVTDANGETALSCLHSEELVSIRTTSKKHGTQNRQISLLKPERDVQEIRLRETASVSGIVACEDPEQLKHVRISVQSTPVFRGLGGHVAGSTNSGSAIVRPDKSGSYEIPAIAAGALRFSVTVDPGVPWLPISNRERFRPVTVLAGSKNTVDFELVRGVKVRGRVIDKEVSRPLPGINVSLVHLKSWTTISTASDDNGEFEGLLAPGAIEIQLRTTRTGYSSKQDARLVIPEGVESFEPPSLNLRRTLSMQAQIVDSRDQPVRNAFVSAYKADDVIQIRRVDADGKFTAWLADITQADRWDVRVGKKKFPATVVKRVPLKLKIADLVGPAEKLDSNENADSARDEASATAIKPSVSISTPSVGQFSVSDPPPKTSVKASDDEKAAKKKPAAEDKPKPTPQPNVKPRIVRINGKVLDAKTGKPVKDFIIQGGRFDLKDPTKRTWGYSQRRSSGSGTGKFSTSVRWNIGWTARIVADGYISQPVLEKAPPKDKDRIEVTVRLQPGHVVTGRVLDHKGQPVEDAAVFVSGPTGLNLSRKKVWSSYDRENTRVKPILTDAEGRFEIAVGEARALAVSCDQVDVWAAPLPEKGESAEIRLPEPGTLAVRYNIEGADDDAGIFIQMLAYEDAPFKDTRVRSEQQYKLKNGGGFIFRNMPPARYQVARYRMVRLASMGRGMFLDRKEITIEPGKELRVSFTRKNGVRIPGKVTGLKEAGLKTALVMVLPVPKPGEKPRRFGGFTIYDCRGCAEDGGFTTEELLPGKYEVKVEGYPPLTPAQQAFTGIVRAAYVGTTLLTVPESGKAPVVEIALEKRKD